MSLRLKKLTLDSVAPMLRSAGALAPQIVMNINAHRPTPDALLAIDMEATVEIPGTDGELMFSGQFTGEALMLAPTVPDEHIHELTFLVVQQELAPYLRELIASTLVRSGYPPFRIPNIAANGLKALSGGGLAEAPPGASPEPRQTASEDIQEPPRQVTSASPLRRIH